MYFYNHNLLKLTFLLSVSDPKSKLWNFSMNDYDTLMLKVAPLAPHIVLGPLPGYVLKVKIMDI